MLQVMERGNDRVVGIRVDGKVRDEELEAVVDLLEERIGRHGTIRVLVHLRDMGAIEPGALLEDLKFALKHMRDFDRTAVVGDQGWLAMWARMAGLLVSGETRAFRTDDLEEAWGWVEDGAGTS